MTFSKSSFYDVGRQLSSSTVILPLRARLLGFYAQHFYIVFLANLNLFLLLSLSTPYFRGSTLLCCVFYVKKSSSLSFPCQPSTWVPTLYPYSNIFIFWNFLRRFFHNNSLVRFTLRLWSTTTWELSSVHILETKMTTFSRKLLS